MRSHEAVGVLLLGLLGAAEAALGSATAHACSPALPSCQPPVRLFPVDAVPGDRIYFKTLVDTPGELTLRDAEGRLIEADVRMIGGDRVFAPRMPVAPGKTLTLTYTTVCPGGTQPPLTPSKQTFKFTTFASDGTPGLTPAAVLYEVGTRLPGTANPERFVHVAYDSPASPADWHLQNIFIKVDGKGYAASGGPWWSEGAALWNSNLELRTRCNQTQPVIDSCGSVSSFANGKHEVEIWSTIVGAGEQPHAKLTVELACDSAPSPTPTPDAGVDAGAGCEPGARSETAPTHAQDVSHDKPAVDDENKLSMVSERDDDELATDEPSAPDALAVRDARHAANGCALASARSGPPALLGLGSIVLALFVGRRRRAR